MGGRYLVVNFHMGGSATNGATQCSLIGDMPIAGFQCLTMQQL